MEVRMETDCFFKTRVADGGDQEPGTCLETRGISPRQDRRPIPASGLAGFLGICET